MSWPSLGLGLLLLVSGGAEEPEEKKPVPVYTNADLDRVAPFRDDTGVSSRVEVARDPAPPPGREREGPARKEAYWRAQTDRHRERLRAARERIEDLRDRIADREARASPPMGRGRNGSRGGGFAGDTQIESLRRRLATMEARLREDDAQFEDRARREGALPGWLR